LNTRRMSWLSLIVLAIAFPVFAQAPIIEYGQPEELRGVSKIFVNTGVYVQERDMIVKVIRKRLRNLEIVSRPEDSDIHLRCHNGEGAIVKLVGDNRERVLIRIRMPPLYSYDPVVNYGMAYARPLIFAREFVKTYRRVNS
jgi:hypothetical protein